jgi:outer membrane receptor protein involved in Fe transport
MLAVRGNVIAILLRLRRTGILFLLVITVLFGTERLYAETHSLHGTVKDRSGAAVAGARVVLNSGGEEHSAVTGADGGFVFSGLKNDDGTLTVSAAGFSTSTTQWQADTTELNITLQPPAIQQSLDVTSTRTAIMPAGMDNLAAQPDAVVVTATELQQWGALSTDDKLRNVAGFTLLRRSGSQTANPTSQGVSLRGLGANGASRALVLVDGIPLNDPFGSWIYWARVPQSALQEVQLVPGGISALYGNDALGGVINLETKPAVRTEASVQGSYGNENSPFGSGWGALRSGQWAIIGSGEGFRTDGYTAVPQDMRGSVDTPVNSQYGSGTLRVERLFRDRGRIFLNGAIYGEDRHNGTPLQVNDTTIRQLAFGTDWMSPAAGLFTLRLYGGTQNYHQTFSSIAANRNSESLTNVQYVPVQQMGMLAQWSKQLASQFTLLAGVDGLDVQGFSNETSYAASKPTAKLSNGGTQESLGAFVEGILQISRKWSLTVSGREDLWSNINASSSRIPVVGMPTRTNYPDRGQNAFSPRLSTAYDIGNGVTLYAAAYRSFRAPTLNELYRSFRVGNVQTFANPFLRAEHFTGVEGGFRAAANSQVSVHGNFYWGETTDPVANVTLTSTPQLINRMRENLGKTQSWGFQAGADIQFTRQIALNFTYQFTDSKVVSFPTDPTLVGNWVPLVAQNEFVFQGTWAAPKRIFIAIQGRTAGNEYDDDQNLLPLSSYFVLSATVSRPLPKGFDIFFQGENLTNNQYEIGRTPVATLGQPILARVGIRWQSRK